MTSSWVATLFGSHYSPLSSVTFNKHFKAPVVAKYPGPLDLFWSDVGNIIRKTRLIGDVLRPFLATNANDELYFRFPSGWELIYFAIGSTIQLPIMLFAIVVAVISVSVTQALININSAGFWAVIQGPRLQVWPPTPDYADKKYQPTHRWVYVNGIATSKATLRQELTLLSTTFHAPVLGIHNGTFGFLGDIIECVFQRAFGYHTEDTNIAVPILRQFLNDPEVERVILVAHSQGGIIASHILDSIYAECAPDDIHNKLEVYTFGSAALWFHNPPANAAAQRGDSAVAARVLATTNHPVPQSPNAAFITDGETPRLVQHMEHYCREHDMVTSFGALSSIKREEIPYYGRVFVWKDQPGHLLNQHYLKNMFPLPGEGGGSGVNGAAGAGGFLSLRAVQDKKKGKDTWMVPATRTTASGWNGEEVRELSNLWKYM